MAQLDGVKTAKATTDTKKVHLISLGCARNRADSEVMLGSLLENDYELTSAPDEASLVVVNTCGFIEPAKRESIETIMEAGELKKANPALKLVVAGCLSQRYKGQLVAGLPEVDLFIGTDEFPHLPQYLQENLPKGSVRAKRKNYLYQGELPKKNTLSRVSSYVKVAEGCQHQCAFCIIPAIRGPLRSRPIQSILGEVNALAEQGVKEINLIAQDLAAYGREGGQSSLLNLLKDLTRAPDPAWIRMLYVYPENIDEEFLDFWADHPRIVPYIDIPVQHGSDRILSLMNREVSRAQLEKTIARVRDKIPSVAIRTSVMVGFPHETDKDFEALLDFVEQNRFDHLGCFTYSQEEGTPAGRMSDQISEALKEERQLEVMDLQRDISSRNLKSYVGKTLEVLVEGRSQESDLLFEGRLKTQAPEVDGICYINDGPVQAGEIQKVTITESHDYDLVGRVES